MSDMRRFRGSGKNIMTHHFREWFGKLGELRCLVPGRRGSFYRVQRVIATRSYHVAGRTARLVPGALKKRGKSMCMTEGFVQPAPSLDKLGLLGELSAHSPDELNKTRVFLVNESTEPVVIPKGTVIETSTTTILHKLEQHLLDKDEDDNFTKQIKKTELTGADIAKKLMVLDAILWIEALPTRPALADDLQQWPVSVTSGLNGQISTATKLGLYNSLVLSILLYGAEAWTLTATEERYLDTFDQRCLPRATPPLEAASLLKAAMSAGWSRPTGRPRRRWGDQLTSDLSTMGLDVATAWQRAQDRTGWKSTWRGATLPGAAREEPQPEHQLPQPEHQLPQPEHQPPQPEHQPPQPEHQLPQPEHQLPQPEHQLPQPEHQLSQPEHQLPQPEHQLPQPEHLSPQPEHQPPQPEHQLTQPEHQLPQPEHQLPQPEHLPPQPEHQPPQPEHQLTQPEHQLTQPEHQLTQPDHQQHSQAKKNPYSRNIRDSRVPMQHPCYSTAMAGRVGQFFCRLCARRLRIESSTCSVCRQQYLGILRVEPTNYPSHQRVAMPYFCQWGWCVKRCSSVGKRRNKKRRILAETPNKTQSRKRNHNSKLVQLEFRQ
ncbi:hypothetical protein Bbelb_291390 [Branchiostoma belcheri]|nr:hypothetical protein Bbelb_291390 [Branchiostoma belcheri]